MVTLTNARVFDGRAMLPGRHDVTLDGKRISSVGEHAGSRSGEVVDVGGESTQGARPARDVVEVVGVDRIELERRGPGRFVRGGERARVALRHAASGDHRRSRGAPRIELGA